MERIENLISYLLSIILIIILCCPTFIIISFRNSYPKYFNFLKNNIRIMLFYSVLLSLFFATLFYIIVNAEHSFEGVAYYLLPSDFKKIPLDMDAVNKLETIGATIAGVIGYSILFSVIFVFWHLISLLNNRLMGESIDKMKKINMVSKLILIFYLLMINIVLIFCSYPTIHNIIKTGFIIYLLIGSLFIVLLSFILIYLCYFFIYGLYLERIKSVLRLSLDGNVVRYLILSLLIFWLFWIIPILRIKLIEFFGIPFTLKWECYPTEGILILKEKGIILTLSDSIVCRVVFTPCRLIMTLQ